MRISLGSPIFLSLEVYDAHEDMFPRAHVYDSNSVEVLGSPFDLIHVANGFYKNTSFTPSISGFYYAVYIIYQDAGYSVTPGRYGRTSETFDVNTLLIDTEGLNAKIGTPVNGSIVNDIIGVNDNIDSDEGRTV
jgi:hypothetical protein